MRERIEQRLVFVLSVKFDESVSQLTKATCGRECAIDERAASSLARDFAANNCLVAVGTLNDSLDGGLDFAGSDEVCGGSRPEKEADSLDEDGLARSGLTREDVEARLELDLDRLDH